MKNKITLISISFFISLNGFSQSSHWQWAKESLGVNNEWAYGQATDVNGNIYITGILQGTAIFGNDTLTTNGNDDILIAKLDPVGNWLWAKNIGGTFVDRGISITTDTNRNVYVTGTFSAPITFGTITLTSGVFFVAKADEFGNWIWAKSVTGSYDCSGIIKSDNNKYLYLTGSFQGTANFGSTTLTALGPSTGQDIFVSKMDTSGNWIWTRRGGSGTDGGMDSGTSISVDESGNIIVGGHYNGQSSPAYFGSILLTSGICTYDTFISKLDSSGNWIWAKTIGWQGSIINVFITGTDSIGNIYLNGNFYGGIGDTIYFGVLYLASNENLNVYAAEMSSAGNWIWVNQATGMAMSSTAKDHEGNSFILGYFSFLSDTILMGNIILNQNTNERKSIIGKIDQQGNWIWGQTASGQQTIYMQSLTLDVFGNIIVSGEYNNQIIFGNDTLISGGNGFNIFVAKMDTSVINSINENFSYSDVNDIILFPSPATNQFTIASGQLAISEIEIYDAVGGCVFRQSSDIHPTINVSGLANGIYFVKAKSEDGINTQKIIVQH